jgi:hypothetical protein
LPALLALFERISPLKATPSRFDRYRGTYGRPFAWLVGRWPGAIAHAGIVVGALGLVFAVHYIVSDPMEYDLWRIRSIAPSHALAARRLSERVNRVVGTQGQEGVAILVDRLDQVLPLKHALEAKRDASPAGDKPFDRVASILDILPTDQEAKVELLSEIRTRLLRVHKHGWISADEWSKIEPYVPPADLRPLGIEDLPEQVARPFIERDGTRGKIVYVLPAPGESLWDAHYLIRWANAVRTTRLPDGSVVEGSGRSVIYADVVIAVMEDAPKAILLSVLGTAIVILFVFRGPAAWPVLASLGLGLCFLLLVMALYGVHVKVEGGLPHLRLPGMKLNFLNFVALPISVGVGADYAMNVAQRIRLMRRRPEGVVRALERTGGAVVLCSLTTTLGYLALTLSMNLAIRSFGFAAAAGELSCVAAAVLVLPAWVAWRRVGRGRSFASRAHSD